MNLEKSERNDINKFFKANKKVIILTLLFSLFSGITSVLDLLVIELLGSVDVSEIGKKNGIEIAVLILIKSIALIIFNSVFSVFIFTVYRRLVINRFMGSIDPDSGFFSSKDLANYTLNESLQAVMTVLIPLFLVTSSLIQILILLIVGSVVLAGDGMLLLVILALCYLVYLVPTQFLLSRLGKKRRFADDLRLDFVSNVVSASREFQLSSQKTEFVDKFLYTPTTIIKNALVIKWVNSESQKSILELIVLLSLFIYLAVFAESISDLQFLIPLVFIGYRVAPLLSRLMVSLQSMSFGMSSIREPVASKYELNVNIKFKSKVREEDYTGNFDDIIDYVCRDGGAGVTMISGVSGIGKSTLLFETARKRKQTQKVAYVGQNSFIAHTSLIDNLPNFKDQSYLLELFDLSDLLKRDKVSFSEVSGGQAQRISILRAIVSDADELYLDEPFSSINKEKVEQLSQLLNEIGKHKPIFLVSHIKAKFLEVVNEIRITEV